MITDVHRRPSFPAKRPFDAGMCRFPFREAMVNLIPASDTNGSARVIPHSCWKEIRLAMEGADSLTYSCDKLAKSMPFGSIDGGVGRSLERKTKGGKEKCLCCGCPAYFFGGAKIS